MCTALPNARGGLAMWIPEAIFHWLALPAREYNTHNVNLKISNLNLQNFKIQGWMWVGVYSAEMDSSNTSAVLDKTDFRFGQSPARTVADRWGFNLFFVI